MLTIEFVGGLFAPPLPAAPGGHCPLSAAHELYAIATLWSRWRSRADVCVRAILATT